MSVSSTSASLLSRARSQDPRAWERLVELYAPLALFWIRRQGVRGSEAEDVLQETFHAAAAGIQRFGLQEGEHSFRAWLRTVARSKVADHFARQARLPNYEPQSKLNHRASAATQDLDQPDAAEESSLDSTEQALQRALLERALQGLAAKVQAKTYRVFELTVLEGRTAQSVAEELGMSGGAVRVAKSRMLARLREELGDRE